MNTTAQINAYIDSLPEPKKSELLTLHQCIKKTMPNCTLWFLDGKNSDGKVIANPNIGYGKYTIKYADGSTRDFYQVGLSSNKTGISVYIMGLADKNYLVETYGSSLGKASITGYCIKFKSINDIDINILIDAVKYGVRTT